MDPDAVDLLKCVRERLPGRWTKGALFRKNNGQFAGVETADKCCLVGHMRVCANEMRGRIDDLRDCDEWHQAQAALERTPSVPVDIMGFNDTPERTEAEVLTALDEAITLLEDGEVGPKARPNWSVV